MSLQVQDLTYVHPDKDVLFSNISFSVSRGDKCAIIGNNGIGKSTLLHLLASKKFPTHGFIQCEEPYLVPQHFGQFDGMTIAEALGVDDKLRALTSILNGQGTEEELVILNDHWTLEEQMVEAFSQWGINYLSSDMMMGHLSGGEKTKVFLSGIAIHQPDIVLMDEPTNHLDPKSREMLYEYIRQTQHTLLIVSHDRSLLNILSSIYEMSSSGMQFYPMNYQAYKSLSDTEYDKKYMQLQSKQKELTKAEKTARETMERQQKHSARGEKQSKKKCVARIAMGNLRNRSEVSSAHLNKVQEGKLQGLRRDIGKLRDVIPMQAVMKMAIDVSSLYIGKKQIEVKDLVFAYSDQTILWKHAPLNFSVYGGERILLQGCNGCGKSSLLKLITRTLFPTEGEVLWVNALNILYLDQEYTCIDNDLTVYEQLEVCNTTKPEHELKMLLNRFLFPSSTWNKKCAVLSGGEKMKLSLCRLLASEKAPNMIIADEPTNNIDISNIEILTAALKNYRGSLLLVSHDEQFIQDVGIDRIIAIE